MKYVPLVWAAVIRKPPEPILICLAVTAVFTLLALTLGQIARIDGVAAVGAYYPGVRASRGSFLFQIPVRIHVPVQDSDDMNSVRRHGVVDSVTADKQHSAPFPHVVAPHPQLEVIRQLSDAAVQLIEILVSLDLAPLIEGVLPDTDEIALG